MVSMKDLSVACGVSVATVSKALNNHNDIGEETKEMIRRKAKEMGYLPNLSARALKTNKTNNIGVLFSDASQCGLTHDYFANVLDQFKHTAEEKGYDITFLNCNKTRTGRMSYYEHAQYRGLDGVMIACIDFRDPEILQLMEGKLPIVTIDHSSDSTSSVMSDNIQGMQALTSYVVEEMGHTKVAYIHGDESSATMVTKNRLSSFLRVMERHGISVPPEYIRTAPYRDMEETARRTKELLELPERPTCILFPDDYAAVGGMNMIKSYGLRIPEDISVAGYDGLNIATRLEPQMTTVFQDTAAIGEAAAKKMVDLIEHAKTTSIEHITVQCVLKKGKTVGKLYSV